MSHGHGNAPDAIRGNDDAVAMYGVLKPFLGLPGISAARVESSAAELALGVLAVFQNFRKVAYWDDLQAQRQTEQSLDDYLHDSFVKQILIAHELCHYWHPDHGEKFFQLLDDVISNWVRRKQELEAVVL